MYPLKNKYKPSYTSLIEAFFLYTISMLLFGGRMTKSDALSKFGKKRAEQVQKMAEMLSIKREAIYQWGNEIPELRAYQIEKLERDGLLPVGAARHNQTA